MILLIFWTILYSIVTALSITLLGDRLLISGNLLDPIKIFRLLFHWKFITSMSLAVFSRFAFIMINNSVLRLPALAESATTVSAFISAFAYITIVISNYIFLSEQLSVQQIIGSAVILLGIFILVR